MCGVLHNAADVRSRSRLHVILRLALAQRLVEALAQRQIGLALGALDELANLPGARTVLLGRLLAVRLLGLRRRSGRGRRGGLVVAATAEHAGHGMAERVTDRRADGHTASGDGHLLQHGRLSGPGGGGRSGNG